MHHLNVCWVYFSDLIDLSKIVSSAGSPICLGLDLLNSRFNLFGCL